MNSSSDFNDLVSLKNGDACAFANVYQRYWADLYTTAYRHVRDEDLSKDIVQEVFITLWERRHLVDTHYESLKPYLTRSVKNSVLNYYKSEKVKQAALKQVLMRMEHFMDLGWEMHADLRRIEDLLGEAVSQLPELVKAVFLLRIENYSIKQIAEKLSIAEQTVKNYLSDAKYTLKADLGKKISENDLSLLLFASFYTFCNFLI